MLHYILQTVAFQIFFLIIYDVLLRKETFFNWNRVYLIGTAFLSTLLPFLKLESFRAIVPEPMVVRLPEVIIGEVSTNVNAGAVIIQADQVAEQAINFSWTYVWGIGAVLTALILAYKMFKLSRLYYANPKRLEAGILFVFVLNSNAAFSFFHYIFLGTEIQADKKEHIVQHELVHVKEKHSVDLLIFEVLRIVFWFNPLIYMYQNRLSTLHEFIADAKVVKHKGKSAYCQSLLSQVFETQHISFINPFFKQSLIKKRIVMLSKSKSKQIHLIKYALLIPMVIGMLLYTSSYASEIKEPLSLGQHETINQELSFSELVDKYYQDVIGLNDLPDDYYKAYKNYGDIGENYIQSKEEVAKAQALLKYKHTKLMEKKKAEGKLSDEEERDLDYYGKKQPSYDEYVAYKKTQQGKDAWENFAEDRELRLAVDDMENLLDAEQQKLEQKLALITKGNKFKVLKMTDGKMTTLLDSNNVQVQETHQSAVSEDVEVPFAVVEEVPIFPGCENLTTNGERKQCMSDKVSMFVNQNFNINIAKEQQLKGRQRISVIFKLGKDGKIKDIKARALHPALEAEAIRILELLPEFRPGKQRGKAVTVPYSLPILFQVQDDVEAIVAFEKTDQKMAENQKEIIEVVEVQDINTEDLIEVPYAVVEEAPYFSSCSDISTKEKRKECTSNEISQFVNKNFNTKLANDLGLKGMQRIMVIFKIGKDGSITDIRSRAPHPDLEKEAIRVIGALPKMMPGKQRGKAVVVPYSLPILFQVNETAPKAKN